MRPNGWEEREPIPLGSCGGMGNDGISKIDKGQTPSMDHSACWGPVEGVAERKTEEYYVDLTVGEVTWVWFTRTGMCAIWEAEEEDG